MAEDRGYGSGKPRSAANSAARREKAASANLRKKNIKKVASKPFQKQVLASVGNQAAAGFNIGGRQYLETGVSANKLFSALKGLTEFGKVSKAATRVSRAAKAKGAARESMIDYEYSQMRGNQDFARELRGFPKSGWTLDQNAGFRNIARTTRRSDVAESAQEIASRLAALQRAKRNR